MEEILNQRNISIPNRNIKEKKRHTKVKTMESTVNKISNYFFIQLFFCIIILGIVCIYKFFYINEFNSILEKYKWYVKYNLTYNDVYNNSVNYINKTFSFNIPLKNNENNIPIYVPNMLDNDKEEIVDNKNSVLVSTSYNNMQILANEIKTNYSLIKPTEGVVSCPFGNRDPSNKDISSFHLGIDIANNTGTDIIAAMEGKVLERKYNSTYGNYLKIVKDDIMIIYAHCSKLLVNEGDNIKQGQKIGLMGQTGLATGPHLHFEIRKNNMVINPEYLLSF